MLVSVVILSAFVPTLIAQQGFEPELEDTELQGTAGEEDLAIGHHHPSPSADRQRSERT